MIFGLPALDIIVVAWNILYFIFTQLYDSIKDYKSIQVERSSYYVGSTFRHS